MDKPRTGTAHPCKIRAVDLEAVMSDQALKERVARAIYYATARNKPYEQLSATQRGQKMAEAQDAIAALDADQLSVAAADIKPCPFCGNPGMAFAEDRSEYVCCSHAPCCGQHVTATPTQWNRRAALKQEA
jgi:hypothetical protein